MPISSALRTRLMPKNVEFSRLRHMPIVWQAAGLLGFCMAVFMLALLPALEKRGHLSRQVALREAEISELRAVSEKIKEVERALTLDQRSKSKESSLKQIERIGHETGVFTKITRISPIRIRRGGTGGLSGLKGLSIEFERLSMLELTAFLEALSYRSLLSIQAIDLQALGEASGQLSARVNVLEGVVQ